jgi:hypothetical protein
MSIPKQDFFMEHLFSTNLAVNGENVVYHVVFDHEKYIFTPEVENRSLPSFSFIREHDEWHDGSQLSPDIKKQALEALEKYLLKQH